MRASRVILIAGVVVLLLVAGGATWWWVSVPHTAEEQFDVAARMEKELRAEAATKSPAELKTKIEMTVEQYRRVGANFGKSEKAAEALKKIAKIWEEVAKEDAKALTVLEQLGKDYPKEEHLGFALVEQARLMKKEADRLKAEKKTEAADKYREALAKLEELLKQFEKAKNADAAMMEIGRIWQDGLEEPLIKPIEIFSKFIEDFPNSEHEPEAMYRLGLAYARIKEFDKSVEVYTELVQKYPKNDWAREATYAKGKLLAEQMEKHEEAAEAFEQMAENFPDDPRAQDASQQAQGQRQQAAAEEGEQYGKERYGGTVPFDTSADKALPPAQLLERFTVQKLDAEMYDLDMTLVPAEHRITVKGTLKMVNRGDEKKTILMMLEEDLKISELTFDGVKVESRRSDEAMTIILPAETVWKKDATAVLGFAYSGQYADVTAMKALMPGPGGGTRGARRGPPATAPGTAPASAPAVEAVPTVGPTTAPALAFNPQLGLGEYGYGLSGGMWYPITIIGDIFQARVVMHSPGEALTNGELVKREKGAGAAAGLFEFQTRKPVFGLYFAYGPYVMKETKMAGAGASTYYTYFKPENAAKHDAYVAVADRILSFYGSKYAGFPFEKMAIAEVGLPPFLGGVGPASLMFLQESMVAQREVPETLLAHELAHQWFGNLIPINVMDAGYNQWLSEGFATYSDALYTEHKDGKKAFDVHIQQYQQLFFQFAMSAPRGMGAIKQTIGPMSPGYRPVVYEKGAIVLHMLRKVMGDDKFFTLMRRYVELEQNKLTTVDAFRRLASEIHGEDLSWFFAQWYDRAVFAHWKVDAAVTADPGEAVAGRGASVRVLITQPGELVKMVADVTLRGGNGEVHVVKDVMVDKKENVVDVRLPFVPVKVVLDEEGWVLKRLGGDHMWPAEKPAGRGGRGGVDG